MSTFKIKPNDTFELIIEITECDQKFHVKFENHLIPENLRSFNEMFLTNSQMIDLGNFLINNARQN